MEFKEKMKNAAKDAEDIIYKFLPENMGYQKTLFEAMEYSFKAGGKRLRPVIMFSTFKAFGGEGDKIYPFMAAIEMIHTYSLIHDDLPELDNDELRRGRPTNHMVYGHGMALLAGDGLLNYAYETAVNGIKNLESVDLNRGVKALDILTNKAGIFGMIGGQCVDVEAEKKNIDLTKDEIIFTYENKTAALLEASLMIGAIMAGCDSDTVASLEKTGSALGQAFQIQDDILDIKSTVEELGKPIGSDEKNGKKTFVSYTGIEEAEKIQKDLTAEAVGTLKALEKNGKVKDKDSYDFLCSLMESLVNRRA